jgi:deoxyribodipyrimidine photo-lyase
VSFNQARLRRLNDRPVAKTGQYILYWMQASRRLRSNHAFDYAARCAQELAKPLVVYEGLRRDYPWASERFHSFIVAGMKDNADAARALGITYWPFVETPDRPARGLLAKIARKAALVVTDDYPCFIVPEQSRALAARTDRAVFAVDSNGVVPLSLLGEAPYAAANLRPRIHRLFVEAFENRSDAEPKLSRFARKTIDPPFDPADLEDPVALVASSSVDAGVGPVVDRPGGAAAARKRLLAFLRSGLKVYATDRSQPMPPSAFHGSGLSPYLHFGHLSIEEVVAEVFRATGGWSAARIDYEHRGRREGFYGPDANANSFLDEALTWRDVGYVWHRSRRSDAVSLDRALPRWAHATLRAHASDPRAFSYSPEEWEAGATHDVLWNAAQKELVATGTIHNYMRMLWGKKVIEWSRDPDEAYATLVHLNNKYALDGRDPNSYTGILWCFGLFDRPWAPERPVLGQIRYMSSENTAKKFRLGPYLEWTATL